MIIDDNVLSDLEKSKVKDIISSIPLYYSKSSTTSKFPYFSHVLAEGRENNGVVEVFSEYFSFFNDIVIRFCKQNNLDYIGTLRGCINATFSDQRYSHQDPHIDHDDDHHVLILYLNEVDGNTVLFKETWRSNLFPRICNVDEYDFTVQSEVSPKLGRVLCFDGNHYHSMRPTSAGNVRFIAVFNILLNKKE